MRNNYNYFATHTANESIYKFLEAGKLYKKMTLKEQKLLDLLAENYYKRDKSKNILNYCSDLITNHRFDLRKFREGFKGILHYKR
jgi:hypothetical protein